ncbi:MAG TPA: PAS domain S-box protein [Steroidobacteraceae bacterium]|nr:PAS domain S-box protein [Steroidobacteraceae bacterium]
MPAYLAKTALLAALYFLAGKLGLTLAVPPGYATVIWPPSGIVLGMLLLHGRAIAPGVFLGSFLLNAMVGHAPQVLPTPTELTLAACIATGSTMQALLGRELIARWFGQPVRLRNVTDILRLLAVAMPLACVVSPTAGVLSLHLLAELPAAELADNWLTWWSGDMFGVLVFLPLTMVLSGRTAMIWRERPVRGLHALSLALLVLPLGLTFIAWKSLAETTWRQSQAHFESLARESEQAINTRLAAYASATRSGAGIFQGSVYVSRDEWQTFIGALRLREDYPGMLGLGWIEHVAPGGAAGGAHDLINYLEPDPVTGAAVGLDLSREPAMSDAANRAAASGLPALTQPVMLGPADDISPGFLLLQPVYRAGAPLDAAPQRRAALRGFVFTAFQARGFFVDLTPSQGRRVDVTLYQGTVDGGVPVFSTRVGSSSPRFSLRREIRAFGTQWAVEWQSTGDYERAESVGGAHFVLFGGLLFTGLFAVVLVVFGARKPAVAASGPLEQPWILPLTTFALVAGSSFAAYALLASAEDSHVSTQVENETRRLEADLDRAARDRLQVVRRMAHRWSAGGGTPYVVWRNDARDLARQIDGLEQLQWIGSDFYLHWSEGTRRRGWVESSDVRTGAGHTGRLEESADRGLTYVTEPREVAPGEWAFQVFAPVSREGRFDGFIAATFNGREFFGRVIEASGGKAFSFSVQYAGKTVYDDGETPAENAAWKRDGTFKVNDRRWTFTVRPTRAFVAEQQTLLPVIVLIAGVLIAFLSAFLVRYVLASRLEAARLQASARALAASEERYELAMRGMSVGVWDWNICTNAVFLSQRCRDLLGITASEFAPSFTGFLGRLHADDRSQFERALQGHLKRQNAFDLELRVLRDNGEFLWVHLYGQAQFDDSGFANRMAGSMQDITVQKRQAQELERSEKQLRLLIESAPVAVAMFDRQMRYLMTSRRWMQDYGLEGREIVGASHYEVFPELRQQPQFIDIHQRALRGERFDHREDSWSRADGQKIWSHWAIHPWRDVDGEVGGIVLFTEDITARKQSEEALRTTEAMNRAAMDKAPIGKALVHVDGRFAKVNAALCQLLGYTEDELLARDFQSITHPADRADDLAHLRSLLEGRAISYQMDKRYLHRDGRVIWVQLSVSVVRRVDGSVEYLVAQFQDITERKNIDLIKDEFVAVVSNELRAPLAAIRDALGDIAAARNLALPDSVQRIFDACRANCERVGSLVEEIVELERLAAGQMRFDFKDEPIADITRHAVSVNEAFARITLRPIDPELMVYVDTARFGRVLSNLLSNAARFSPADSGIEVGAELRGEWVRVYVRDEGEGIPEEFRARIFGKFSHADSTTGRHKGGAGLGLFLTRQMVEQMRGTIGFVTQVGVGTTFWVELPRVSRGSRRLSA